MSDDHLSLKGRLLVAHPVMTDENFARTIVLVLEHSEVGALGLVLNRPTQTPASDIVADLGPLAAPPGVVHLGGPVALSSAICLGLAAEDGPNGPNGPDGGGDVADGPVTPLFGRVVAVDLDGDHGSLARRVRGVRLFAGYAGWSPGQLDDELESGGWFVVDRVDGDAVSPDPVGLWRTVLRRQPDSLVLLANFPADPTSN